MKWAKISIDTSRESEDAVSNLLVEMGSGGVQTEDDRSNPDKVIISAYFPPDDMIGERVSKITKLLNDMRELNIDIGAGKISLEQLDEKEWSEPWKEFFKPLPVGKRILVVPSWEEVDKSTSRDIIIQIDPGMAFGTGRHSTTILSLELLEDVLKGGERVVDVGTGSGILAIAAIKMGAERVVGIDVETRVVEVAKENIQKNGVSDKVDLICGELLSPVKGKYDVIVSNISSKMISAMVPDFGAHLDAGGKVILSGILDREAPEMLDRLRSYGFAILEMRRDEEWAGILAGVSE